MTFQKDKTTVAQTAANASATIVAALVGAEVIGSVDAASEVFAGLRDEMFAELSKVVDGDNAMFKAEDNGSKGGSRAERSSAGSSKSRGGASKSKRGGGKSSGFPGDLADALKLELNSGAFEGTTLGDVVELDAADTDADYGYGDGERSGEDYIAWLASPRNKNPYTRGAAALIAEDRDIEVLD